jgi:uncharacterized protein YdiU (UPF0061 family)
VANWIRVGYCQGNFNSDNCAAGGYTLDYGPFGFCELFDPRFQPWTGGGEHFCFFNQPAAAEANYQMFWSALRPLLEDDAGALAELDGLREGFSEAMRGELEAMWTRKLGLASYDDDLLKDLLQLLASSRADYTLAFRQLSELPEQVEALKPSFYLPIDAELEQRWTTWLQRWREQLGDPEAARAAMRQANPQITWREWLIAPAYERAAESDLSLIQELQTVFRDPYAIPPAELAATYDRLKPREFFNAGGLSHYSCSS